MSAPGTPPARSGAGARGGSTARVLAVLACGAAYVAAFAPLHGVFGQTSGAFSLAPVLVAGLLSGKAAAVGVAVAFLPVNVALYAAVGPGVPIVQHLGGLVACALVGLVVGHLRTMRVALEEQRRSLEEALAALRDRELQLTRAQEASQTGSWDLDLETNTATCSREFERILGLGPQIAPTREALRAHVHPEDREAVKAAVDRAIEERGAYDLEHRVVRPDGQIRFMHSSGQVLADASGRAVRIVGTGRDVTERKVLESKLMLAERMAALGTLAGGVAHEVNNPLACVMSNLAFLSGELAALAGGARKGDVAELRHAVDDALAGAERVHRIVRDLQTFARSGRHGEPVELHEVLDRALRLASGELQRRARVVRSYGEVPPVHGDASLLGQVALNLLLNAAQSIPEGRPRDHEIRVVTRVGERGDVVVEVHDTGGGIAPEVRGRVFEPFFTTRAVGEGTGLGLSVCHGIVTALGGELGFESEQGKGSVFRVSLPAAGAGRG